MRDAVDGGMFRQPIVALVPCVGFFGGACASSADQREQNRDANVADLPVGDLASDVATPETRPDVAASDSPIEKATDLGIDIAPDRGIDTAPDQSIDVTASETGVDIAPSEVPVDIAAVDSPPSSDGPRAGKVTCDQHPVEGESCDPLPAGLFCRHQSCTGGCLPECRCSGGRWHCTTTCRDYSSPDPIDCGMPPLCREQCLAVPVLGDGGLAYTDGVTIGYRYPLRFTPVDVTTLWGDQSLQVTVGTGPPLETARLDDLASRITLRTWPELDTVPSTTTVSLAPSVSETGRVTLTPKTKLSERWYALYLSGLPFWATADAHTTDDGAYLARFAVGSDPRVNSVTFAGGASKHRLYIAMSEPVVASASLATLVQVRQAGAPVVCTDVAPAVSTPLGQLSFDCPTLAQFPDEISVGAGLLSATGAPLLPVVLRKIDLTLTSCGSGCEMARAP